MIKSMRICCDSVLAEIRRALLLQPAVKQWLVTLDEGLTGREQRVARAQKAQWTITDSEWDVLSGLVKLSEPFERASLASPKMNIESCLRAILLTYSRLLDLLNSTLKQPELQCMHNSFKVIKTAVSLGRDKQLEYIQKSDLSLLASRLRLTSFSDAPVWGDATYRGRVLLEHLYDVYITVYAEAPQDSAQLGNHVKLPSEWTWTEYLMAQRSAVHHTNFTEEIRDYFANEYPWKGTNLLDWWK
ncbi:hypothetical protein FRC10_001906, partial [Ceratobasidium sp. 414]